MNHQAIESRLRGDPSDASAWEAYSEWLIQQGDPRGELIRLSQLRAQAPTSSLRHITQGQEIERLSGECGQRVSQIPEGAIVDWHYGFVVGLKMKLDDQTAAALRPFLAGPDSFLLRSLRFDSIEEPSEDEEEEFDEEAFDKPPEAVLAGAAMALAD